MKLFIQPLQTLSNLIYYNNTIYNALTQILLK